jgi:hypothetical protein
MIGPSNVSTQTDPNACVGMSGPPPMLTVATSRSAPGSADGVEVGLGSSVPAVSADGVDEAGVCGDEHAVSSSAVTIGSHCQVVPIGGRAIDPSPLWHIGPMVLPDR